MQALKVLKNKVKLAKWFLKVHVNSALEPSDGKKNVNFLVSQIKVLEFKTES